MAKYTGKGISAAAASGVVLGAMLVTAIGFGVLYVAKISDTFLDLEADAMMVAGLLDQQRNLELPRIGSPGYADRLEAVLHVIEAPIAAAFSGGNHGEIVVGHRLGNGFRVLRLDENHGFVRAVDLPFGGERGTPMARALKGERGHARLVDYRGVPVLAAYVPIPSLDIALVSKMDVTQVRAPFVKAAVGAASFYFLMIVVIAGLTLRQGARLRGRLKEAEGRFQALVSVSPNGVYESDAAGNFTYVNQRWCELTGLGPEEALGTGWIRAIHRDDAERVRRAWSDVAAARAPFLLDFRFQRPDGTVCWVRSRATWLRGERGRISGITGTATDITDRQQAEDTLQRTNDERTAELARSMIALRESEERFKAFMNHTAAVAWMKDAEGRYVYINHALEERFNFTLDGVQGKTDFELFPADVAKQLREHDLAVLASDQAAELQEEAPVSDGSMRQWMTFKFPFRDASGRQFVGGMAFDVTERMVLEQQVRQADKLAAIGQLTTGLAHEIGTPLGIIAGRAETLVRKVAPDDPQRSSLEVILRQIDRITKLVDQLCAFARSRPAARRPVSLAPLVREVLSLVEHQVRDHGIVVDVDCPEDLPLLVAEPDQIQQVLLNLVVNAIQAMPEGGRLVIRAGRTVPRRHREDALKDRYVKIEVVDEGVGIATESLSKIFDPFYTTKDVGKGTGLGLAISSRIAHGHGGWIRVKSRPGEGATFSMYLPLVPEAGTERVAVGSASRA